MASIRVDVDVDLEVFRTTELINELRRRKEISMDDLANLDVKEIIHLLEEFSCPQSILDELSEWANQPVSDIRRLEAWKEACGV